MQYKILIVDDEPMLTELLADYLGDMGYLPFMATDSVQAMEKLKESPDLILLDINMPGMDGLEPVSYTHLNSTIYFPSLPPFFLKPAARLCSGFWKNPIFSFAIFLGM